MAEWKKVIVSGSVAELATVSASTGIDVDGRISATNFYGDGSGITGISGVSDNNFTTVLKNKLDGISTSADVTDATTVAAAGALMDSEMTDLAGVKGVTISTLQVKPSEGAFANGDKTKLDAIEAAADVTDTANVTSAGALMDSEVTNLSQVKAFDSSDYATSAQGTKADSAQQPPSEGAFANGDKTKLDGIEASANVTDAANVTAAGALMDSELTDLAGVKGVTISTLQVKPSEGAFADGDKTKLDGISASADVNRTDAAIKSSIGTGNGKFVPAAGSNGQFLKHDGTFGTPSYTTNTNTQLSQEQVEDFAGALVATGGTKTGITVTYDDANGNMDFVVASQTDQNFTNADHTKLNGIESSATADQTASEITALLNDVATYSLGTAGTGTVTVNNALTVTGNLTVSGTTTTVDTANLNVTDQFINLNDGGSAADGGLVIEGAGVSYGWDNSEGRWGFDAAGATEGQSAITSDAYAVAAVTSDVTAYRKNGNIRVESDEIYIYVE
jgi:hypothetical protein